MSRLLLASILVSLAFLPSCIPLGCGGFQGKGDQVYSRGQDELILCENGGFVATTSIDGTIEGRVDGDELVRGDNGAFVSALDYDSDGTLLTPDMGANAWQPVQEDQTALDHADTACQTLETRSWWNTAPT